MNKITFPHQSGRLLSLDILRGITIAGMIMVNNPGSWNYIYTPLGHAHWHGLTPTDLVFPFFMFIMGVSTYMSLRKFDFEPSGAAIWKVVRRTILIFLIGLALGWFGQLCRGLASSESFIEAAGHFDTIRILGVLQRLALAYGFASLIALLFKERHIILTISILLIGYYFLLLVGNGYEMSEQNIISVVDRAILGENHMISDWTEEGVKIAFEPEGLLSTIPSIAHVLIGFLFGGLIIKHKDNHTRVEKLLIWGTVLAFSGLLFSYNCPINKKIWSPTFVLTTTGFAAQLLGLLIWIIDINQNKKWSRFFHAFGVNPLIVYVFAGVMANLLLNIKVSWQGEIIPIKNYIYSTLIQPWAGNYFGSLLYALLFVSACWLFGYISVNFKVDILKYYMDNLDHKYDITYFQEDKPLGTIGSISLLKGKIETPFFVSNCDSLIDQDFRDVYDYHVENKNDLTIVTTVKSFKIPYGVLETGENGLMTGLLEKPELTYQINTGVYILNPKCINEIPEGKLFHITHLMEKIKSRGGRVGCFPVSEYAWRDMGEWPEYLKMIKVL
jgi:predicted acyltransferase